MSQAHLGCFSGTVTPNVNMLDIFKQNERADNPNSILNFGQMSLRKLQYDLPRRNESENQREGDPTDHWYF